MPTTKENDDYRCVVSGVGGNDVDEMTVTTAMSSITHVNEFIGENASGNTTHNYSNNDDDHGSNSTSDITKIDNTSIFWEKALITTCLQHATIASSCAQIYRQVSDWKNNRTGNEKVEKDPLIIDNADMLCEILGNRENGCAYIRWDGSIANNDIKQFSDILYGRQRHHHPPPPSPPSMVRQQDIPRYYTTAVVECKQMFPSSSSGSNAHTASTSVTESNNYIKFHHNYNMQQNGESMLSSSTTMNNQQVEHLAQLSGMYLTDKILLGKGNIRRRHTLVDAESIPTTTAIAETETETPPTPSSWSIIRYPIATSLFQLLKSGTTRAIHGALSIIEGAEESDQYFDSIGNGYNQSITSEVEEDESSSLRVRKLLTKDVASDRLENEDDDDDVTALTGWKKRQQRLLGENSNKHNIMSLLPPVSSNDMLISIVVVAYTCRHLLTYAQNVISSRCDTGGGDMEEEEGVDVRSRAAEKCNTNYSDFFVPMTQGDDCDARILMYREGWGACSFGMFCRKAGSYCTLRSEDAAAPAPSSASSPLTTSATMVELAQYGKILSDMTREEVDLLATTLCKSNFALVEKDIIVIFPGGVPADFYRDISGTTLISSSVFALFQIHVTKIAITNKIVRLERDANVAKNKAIKARRENKNTTELALMHMRRRKATLDELDRCASLLSNLDACEIRLERARDDVRLVQSYTYLRLALQDVRKSRDEILIGSNSSYEDVEELMFDIREEMDEMKETNRRMNEMMTIEQYAEIDEAELNEEFRRLELECESTVSQEQSHLEVNEDQGSAKRLNPQPTPITGPKNDEPAFLLAQR